MIRKVLGEMEQPQRERMLRRLFRGGILLKGVDGILETIGGVLFLFMSRASMNKIVVLLTQHELIEDPDDWVALTLRHAFSHLSPSTKLFGSAYLLAHGIIKIFLAVYLLRNKPWSYPVAIAFLISFIGYQIYRLGIHFSWGLMVLTGFDMAVVLLVWHEYGRVKRRT